MIDPGTLSGPESAKRTTDANNKHTLQKTHVDTFQIVSMLADISQLIVPKTKPNLRKHTFSVAAPMVWN